MYSQGEGSTFGWKSADPNNIISDDFINNGKYCETGVAYPLSEFEGRCTSFKEMKFNG